MKITLHYLLQISNVIIKKIGMKKILVVILVALASASSTFAINPADCEVFYKLNKTSTFEGLVRYLKADSEQAENLKYIFEVTENKMKTALNTENEVSVEKALKFNLANAKNILTKYQYKKYLEIVNLSVNNRDNEVLLTQK